MRKSVFTECLVTYEKCCNDFVNMFAKKHGLEFEGWIGDNVGGIADFINQYYFNMDDIILDLRSSTGKYFIMEWQDATVAYSMSNEGKPLINDRSWIMGLRYTDL